MKAQLAIVAANVGLFVTMIALSGDIGASVRVMGFAIAIQLVYHWGVKNEP